jgi:glyoxylase-like metal-dependent hydrolase (beta-lactamase superfamily II)
VQGVFKDLFNLEPEFATDGRQFDRLFADGERFAIGALQAEVMAMPGHTPACVAYRIADAVFVGETLFMPDVGTARCDFPGGDARTLYRSIRRLLDLPPSTRLFMCHDYPPGNRAPRWKPPSPSSAAPTSTSATESRGRLRRLRTARDATLAAALTAFSAGEHPRGQLPPAEQRCPTSDSGHAL